MDTDIKLRIRLESLITEREGMLAENTYRIDCDHSIAYGDEAFFDLAKKIRELEKVYDFLHEINKKDLTQETQNV